MHYRILDRYIMGSFLRALAFIMLLFVAVVVLLHFVEFNEYYIMHRVHTKEILGYYLSFIPFTANFLSPIIIFTAAVFVTARMSQHNEVIAMLCAGISLRRIMLPYMLSALLLAALSFVLTGWVLAKANQTRVHFEVAYIDLPLQRNNGHIHLQLSPSCYLYLASYHPHKHMGEYATLDTIVEDRLVSRITARYLRWNALHKEWHLVDWQERILGEHVDQCSQGTQKVLDFALDPKDFQPSVRLHEMLNIGELKEHIAQLRRKGADNVHYFVNELYVRYMSPFAALVLTLLGVVIAVYKAREGIGKQIGLGFTLATVYTGGFFLVKGMADAGSTYPLLTIWLPNICCTIVTALLYRYTPK